MAFKPESLSELFESVKAKFPASLGPEKWFLVVATSALMSCSDPFQLGQLYVYLTKQPEYSSLPRRSQLDKRLREFMIEKGLNTGATKVTAWSGTINEEQPADGYITKSSAQLDAANHEKDTALLEKLYGPDGSANDFTISGAHFKWQAKDVIDRMVCVDDGMLDYVERQLITYVTLMCQGLSMHPMSSLQDALGGFQTMNLSVKEIKQLTECGELVASWAGLDMEYWPELKIVKASAGREVGILCRPSH